MHTYPKKYIPVVNKYNRFIPLLLLPPKAFGPWSGPGEFSPLGSMQTAAPVDALGAELAFM